MKSLVSRCIRWRVQILSLSAAMGFGRYLGTTKKKTENSSFEIFWPISNVAPSGLLVDARPAFRYLFGPLHRFAVVLIRLISVSCTRDLVFCSIWDNINENRCA